MSVCGCVHCHHTQPQNISGFEQQGSVSHSATWLSVGLCSTPPDSGKPRLTEAPLLAAALADVAGKETQRVTPSL